MSLIGKLISSCNSAFPKPNSFQKTPVAPYSNEKRDGNLFTANQTDKNDVQDFCNQFLFPVLKEFHASLTPDELAVMLAGNQ